MPPKSLSKQEETLALAAALEAERQHQLLLLQQQNKPDAPHHIQEAIISAFRSSQLAEKESKGLAHGGSTSNSNNQSLTSSSGRILNQSNIDDSNRRVSFGGKQEANFVTRSEARLDFDRYPDQQQSPSSNLSGSITIQPHQYAKLFSHSGFSPAGEEVYYASENARLMSMNKKKNNINKTKNNNNGAASTSSRSSSAGGSSTTSSRKNLKNKNKKSSSSSKLSNEDRRLLQRKAEETDPIFHSTALTADAGCLRSLADACMALRPGAADNIPASIPLRLDEVDRHALFAVGPSANLKNLDGLETVITRLVEPYKNQSWKLSHLEATLCRVRALYRWITAFVKLDAPPLPPSGPVVSSKESNSNNNILQNNNSNNNGQGLPNSGVSTNNASGALKGGAKSTTTKKVGIKSQQQSQVGGGGADDEFGNNNPLGVLTSNNNTTFGSLLNAKPPSIVIPKFFPYKLQDCDDPDDADLLRSEINSFLENKEIGASPFQLPQLESMLTASDDAAANNVVIGQETSVSVFNSRIGDCHTISTLFSFMVRHKNARILPDAADAADFAGLGIADANAQDLALTSDRKTVAGPTGRAAAKCDAARSPSAAKRRERELRSSCGGGAQPCSIITVRGTLKGCLGQNGRAAGYIPWSWNLITLPDGKKYLVDVSMSMAQITEKFCLVMGQHLSLAELKRVEAFTTTYNQTYSSYFAAVANAAAAANANSSSMNNNNSNSNNNNSDSNNKFANQSSIANSSGAKKPAKAGGGKNDAQNLSLQQQQAANYNALSNATSNATAMLASSYLQQQQQQNAAAQAAEREKQDRYRELCSIVLNKDGSSNIMLMNNICSNNNQNHTNKNSSNIIINNTNNLFIDSENTKMVEESLREKPLPPLTSSSSSYPTFSNFSDAPLVFNAPTLDVQTAAANSQFVSQQQFNQIVLENSTAIIEDNNNNNAVGNKNNITVGGAAGKGGQQQQQNMNNAKDQGGSNKKSLTGQQQQSGSSGVSSSQQQQGSSPSSSPSLENFGYPQVSPTAPMIPQNPHINESLANTNPHHYAAQHLLSHSPAALLIKTFAPFFFFTQAQEFVCSHFPRRAQHMLLCPWKNNNNNNNQNNNSNTDENNIDQQQPSQGVFKHPLSQGAWESYPRLSHRFLELGLRLKSRARRSAFSLASPPEYISIDANRGDPARIETKLFVFKSMPAFQLHAISPLAPSIPPALIPNAAGVNETTTASSQQQKSIPIPNNNQQLPQTVTDDHSSNYQVQEFKSSQHREPLTKWVREQQTFLTRFWNHIYTASSSSSSNQQQQSINTTTVGKQAIPTSNSNTTSGLSPAATKLQQALLPSSRGWAATTCQRSTGVFTHTLTVPDVGVYTVVVGVREINPITGRPCEPYFWPAVTYQVQVNFIPTSEPMIAHQKEASVVKLVRPLISQLPAYLSVPFVVAPLLPRVRGVAVINAIEKPRPTKQQLLQQQQQIQKEIMLLMQKEQQEAAAAAAAAAANPTLLPPVKSALKNTSSSTSKSSHKETANQQQQQQATTEATPLQLLQQQLQKLIHQQANESQYKSVIEKIQVTLLKWEPTTATFQGEVFVEPGNVSVWAILEAAAADNNNNNKTITKSSSNKKSSDAIVINAESIINSDCCPSVLETAIQQQQQILSSVAASAAQQKSNRHGGPAAAGTTTPSTTAAKASTPNTKSRKDNSSLLGPNHDDGDDTNQNTNENNNNNPPELEAIASRLLSSPTIGRSLPKTMIPVEDNVFVSKFNARCLPTVDLQGRGMEQILQAIIPAPPSSSVTLITPAANNNNNNSSISRSINNNNKNSKSSPTKPSSSIQQQQKLPSSSQNGRRSVGGNRYSSLDQNNNKDGGELSSNEPVNLQLESFTSTIKQAAKLNEKIAQSKMENHLSSSSGENNTNNEQLPNRASANSTPALVDNNSNHKKRAGTPSTLSNANNKNTSAATFGHSPSSGNFSAITQNNNNNNNFSTGTTTASFITTPIIGGTNNNALAFAVPVWTNISVQRKIPSKEIAVMTNGIGLGMTIGISEVALGMSNAVSSFRRGSVVMGPGNENELLMNNNNNNNNRTTNATNAEGVIEPQDFKIQDIENRRHGLVFPVILDLAERNAINLALCSAGGKRQLKAHGNNVGKLFEKKKATF